MVRKGIFPVRFADIQDKIIVVQRGIYLFDNKPFVVKPWNPEMQINTEAITLLPFWVQLPELDIKYWGMESLSKIEGPHPDYVEFVNDFNVVVRQKVKFEWMPVKCGHCQMLGHIEQECGKKGTTKMEWREQEQIDGFIRVQSRTSVRSISKQVFPIHSYNGFKVLEREKDEGNQEGLSTNRKFFITFVYGFNQETNRWQMWEDLKGIAQGINEAWCVLGDFNSVLRKEDRIGGAYVLDSEISKFAEWIDVHKLQEIRSSGAYFSWTNKTIWSRINIVFINMDWHARCDSTSYHLPSLPKAKT
ncbi:hypothetical protein Cgig2_019205 [Carnegiea gigantea]|uniref:DUF4283 domain-containing protein n=1 Tax=Carnegiea gigantea TaxID=171969 RepID=A0A9Q1JHK2_9CARY|nr:hypothetical protein Cgig2_019205 [Carnegiea gigantea]